MSFKGFGVTVTLAVTLAVAAGGSAGAATPGTKWLCSPRLASDPCRIGMATTVDTGVGVPSILPDESGLTPGPRPRRPVDCFYVYPTVSSQPTDNATLAVDPEIAAIAKWQASKFSEVCDVYAPVYRQLTLAGILKRTGLPPEGAELAYSDVRAAWRNYMRKFNKGRGVVLIGHSQGAGILKRLVQRFIDERPSKRRRLVSALIIGGNVVVPEGRMVGGDFRNVRGCTSGRQLGCVVAYSAFSEEPPPGALFGRVDAGFAVEGQAGRGDGFEIMCVNPAAIGGGSGMLDPYLYTEPFPGTLGAVTGELPEAVTPWVNYPGLYRATCRRGGGTGWLDVDDVGDPGDGRTRIQEVLGPSWGLHVAEVNLALGNLVPLVYRQARAWVKRDRAQERRRAKRERRVKGRSPRSAG